MKLQLDLDNKIIRIEETVNLLELFDLLKKFFPQGDWKEFAIETNVTVTWTNPITIFPYVPYVPYRHIEWPWWKNPQITYGARSAGNDTIPDPMITYSLNSGIYSLDIQK